ncbi:MAG: hypothetical protein NC122_03860 [Faecalibacterium sp.]|nr:hypothetical protein [Ruminococcus sp.]MCM1392773.1 hypothetical protein [Ruminococcus sp.]MCM1485321.1 hypothetical protein [Faecalibacterium sp.]
MKEVKRKEKKYPKLSETDNAIYKTIGILMMASASVIMFLSFCRIMFKKYLIDGVLAVNNSSQTYLLFPLVFYLLIGGAICFYGKKPIFGNPKINYLNLKKKYVPVLPVFDKRYINAKSVIIFFTKILIIVTIGIFTAVLFKFSITSRYEITQYGIDRYNIYGNQTEHLDFDQIESCDIYGCYQTYKRTLRFNDTKINFYINLKNGKTICFQDNEFKDIMSIGKFSEIIKNKPKTTDSSYIDLYIKEHSLSDKEEQIIRGLFQ